MKNTPRLPSYSQGILLVLLSAFFYGLQPLFSHYAYQAGADPVGLLLCRFSLAAAIMWLWLHKQVRTKSHFTHVKESLLIGVGYAAAGLGYYSASHTASVSLAVILLFSFPAFVTLFSLLVLKEQATWNKIISLILASAGVLLATGMDFRGDLTAVFWALFAALSYGSAILYGTYKVGSEKPMTSATIILTGAALTFLVTAFFQGAHWPSSTTGWVAILALSILSTIAPIALFIRGAPHIGASNASTLSTLEPIVAVGIAILMIGEQLNQTMIIGGLLVVIAAIVLSRNKANASPQL